MKLIFISTLILLSSCLNKEIEVTPAYIINGNWDDEVHSIEIIKMRLKKDSILPYTGIGQADILGKLEDDSSFIYYAIVEKRPGESYNDARIYFDRDNGFSWSKRNSDDTTNILGRLKPSNWYRFENINLAGKTLYVGVDSLDNAHMHYVFWNNF